MQMTSDLRNTTKHAAYLPKALGAIGFGALFFC